MDFPNKLQKLVCSAADLLYDSQTHNVDRRVYNACFMLICLEIYSAILNV